MLQLPGPMQRVAPWLCPRVVAFSAVLLIMKHAFPDMHRTCRFWRGYLPIHVRYLYTKVEYQERRGYSPEVREQLLLSTAVCVVDGWQASMCFLKR